MVSERASRERGIFRTNGQRGILLRRLARIISIRPPRRRRMWKYVSPRRRRVGLLLLAVLMSLLYAGWYFTRSGSIRRQAKYALEDLTGADVDVDDASFSLFEGIRLFRVRVRIRGENEPFFTAEEVVLKHRPAALVFRRRIEPTNIICLRPTVNLEYENRGSNAERLFRIAAARRGSETKTAAPLPEPNILLQDGLLRSRARREGRVGPIVEEQFTASLYPKGNRKYEVTVQGPRRGGGIVEWARLELDAAAGTIRPLSGSATERWFVHMPPEYRAWLDRYAFRGEFTLVEGEGTDTRQGRYEIILEDFSMKLPESEGNLTLTEVRGRLRFTRQFVEMRDVTGRVEEAGRAVFTLNGRYDGYARNSPFRASIRIRGLRFPDAIRGPLEGIVQMVQREFRPQGTADVVMTFRRNEKGENDCVGRLEPQDAALTYRGFPLPVQQVRGAAHFTRAGVRRIAFTARRGEAEFTIAGELNRDEEHRKTLYDIRVSGKNVALDEAVRQALPEAYRPVWEKVSPSGVCDVDVHVVKKEPLDNATVDVDLHLKGAAAVAVEPFPYPLKNLTGEIALRGKDIRILPVQSRSGRMLVQAEGEVRGLTTQELSAEIRIQARNVPIDPTLLSALRGNLRRRAAELQPGGEIDSLSVHIARPPDGPMEYDIVAGLKNASFCYQSFPYAVGEAEGELKITPRRITIPNLRGRHGNASVVISGTVELGGETSRPPAYDLAIRATGLSLDEEFHDALPEHLQTIWRNLSPSGLADADIAIRRGTKESSPDWRITVQARDASLLYRDFPYPLRHIRGLAICTPGRVRLKNMRAGEGETEIAVSGELRHDPRKGQNVSLRISAENLPLDRNFLAAVPAEVVPLVKRFRPGGRIHASLSDLRIHRPAAPESSPTFAPAAPPASWEAQGELAFRDAVMDIGFGPKTMTGRIVGQARQEGGKKLALDARAELTRLAFEKHEATNLKGRLLKRPDSEDLQINHVSALAYDGKIDGELTIRLTDPIHYEFSASLWNLDLEKLVNAGETDPKKHTNLHGLLSGRLSVEFTGGKTPRRQAVGELTLSRGRLFELPVFLGLVNVVYLQLPGEGAFNRGFVNYHLRNNVLRFDEIYLTGWDRQTNTGRGFSILGAGEMNMATEKLDLTFLTGPPGELPRLDEITEDILEALSRSLVEVHVTGTLRNPKMDTVPLSPLAIIIRRLLEPSLKTE